MEYRNQEFDNADIYLSDNAYTDCVFRDCRVHFDKGGLALRCTFINCSYLRLLGDGWVRSEGVVNITYDDPRLHVQGAGTRKPLFYQQPDDA